MDLFTMLCALTGKIKILATLIAAALLVGVAAASWALIKKDAAYPDVGDLLKSDGPIHVAMVGDSITFLRNVQTTWPTLTGSVGFYNFGVPSENTSEILARIPAILSQNPKSVFLLGGVNDITTGLSREQTVSNIRQIIELCQSSNVPVYVQAILMVTNAYVGAAAFNTEIDARNALLRQLVMSSEAVWIDWRSILTPPDFQPDGIHLLLSGYKKWALAISPYAATYR